MGQLITFPLFVFPLFVRHLRTGRVHMRACHSLRNVPRERLELVTELGEGDHCWCIESYLGCLTRRWREVRASRRMA